MRELKQSTTYDLMIFMTDSADHLTGKTGLTLTITASKAGAAFASITPTVTERGSGWYSLALTTTHTNTLGDFAGHVTATGADAADFVCQVVANLEADTFGRLGAPAGASVSADVAAVKTQTAAIETDTQDIQTRLPAALVSGRMDSSVGAMAANVITATSIAADAIGASELAADAVTEIRNAITGGAYALDTDANGRVRIVDGTGAGELDTASGKVDVVDKTGFRLSATGVDDIWDEVQSGHATAGTFGKYLDSSVSGVSTGGLSAADIADAVWDEALSAHLTPGTAGFALDSTFSLTDQVNAATIATSGAVNADGSETTTSFKTNLGGGNDHWNDATLVFTTGALAGLVRVILDFAATGGVVTLDEALPSAPANGVAFTVRADHVHPVTQVAAGVWANAARTITGGTVTTVSDKTGYSLSQTFPANFASLAIAGGVVSADVKKVNAVTLTGAGVLGDEWRPL